MKPISQFLLFTYNPRVKVPFFILPFVVMALAIATIFLTNFLLQSVILWPVFVAILYFVIWLTLICLRSRYHIEDGKAQKTEFKKVNDIFNTLKQEARAHSWMIEEKAKTPTADLGFNITGTEDGISFEIEIANPVAPLEASAFPSSAIYMPTNTGENFEIRRDGESNKNSKEGGDAKTQLTTEAGSDIAWLMKENRIISKISFDKKSMGALIHDYAGMKGNLKTTVSKLANVVKAYNAHSH